MKKIAVIYNICGLGNPQNVKVYKEALNSILTQTFMPNCELFISSCMSKPHVENDLRITYDKKINFNWIDENLPLTVTFNHTVRKAIEIYGNFEGYLYVDSGSVMNGPRDIEALYERLQTNKYAMISTTSNTVFDN